MRTSLTQNTDRLSSCELTYISLCFPVTIGAFVGSAFINAVQKAPSFSEGLSAVKKLAEELITGQIALHLVKQGQCVCIASFEMKPEKTLERMMRQFAGEYIDEPLATDREAYITKLVNRMDKFLSNKMYLYDQQGSTSPDKVIAMARYCAMELGVKHIVIDSLMKCVKGEDDFNGQKNFVDELTALARDHSVHIHLVHHIRKLVNEEQQPNKHDLKGSGSISDQVDNVFLMWRNKKKENMRNRGEQVDETIADAFLMCEKQRNGEYQEWYSLWYHAASQQFVENLEIAGSPRKLFR